MKIINKSEYNKLYYQKNKEKELERARKYREEHPEKIKVSSKSWYIKKGKKYREENIESFRERSKEWARKDRLNNPDKYKQFAKSDKNKLIQKRYRENNHKEVSERNISYARERIKTDINYRLRWLLRSRINIAIKKQLGTKSLKTMELLGCSIQQAREHIESQFKDGMTWKNHGTWEIDHIIPVSKFNLTNIEEQKKCFHYTNLQPLNWEENRRKSNRIVI